jgi:hypothetical protein
VAIPAEWQDELRAKLRAWDEESDHGSRRGPFDKMQLTCAEVYWLAEHLRDSKGMVPKLHLQGADINFAWDVVHGPAQAQHPQGLARRAKVQLPRRNWYETKHSQGTTQTQPTLNVPLALPNGIALVSEGKRS